MGISKASIVRRVDLTPDIMKIWLEPEVKFDFEPGQYCTIGISDGEGKPLRGRDGKALWRAYSIVSAPHEECLELFIELVPPPDGNLTPLLWEFREGQDVLLLPRAKGIFTFDGSRPNQFMVATVTGAVPYISILRDYFHRNFGGHRFFVLQGASYTDEFGYEEELEEMAEAHPGIIRYIPTISRPADPRNSSWKGQIGRVNLIVEEYLAKFNLAKNDTIVYVCGHPGMIEDVKQRLLPAGWFVKEERFWK